MLRLYNSLTRSKKIFTPVQKGVVNMYSCGPTVYDHVHIGNLRSFIVDDLLQRVLRNVEHYKVNWVMNITDIDDRMIEKIHKDYSGIEPMQALGQLADKYTDMFIRDIETVGINRADIKKLPRATDHIEKMQELIKKLLLEKNAYVSEGSIYFSLDNYQKSGNKYGQLVNIDYDAKARVTDDQDQKEGASDFVLWKAKKDDEPAWDFEWLGENYPGRPGWHIECSVMSTQYLGQPFDIHTGGVDLKFPHHENEIAQCGGVQANYFVHNEFLQISGEKMSKSLNNFTTISQMPEPLAFRFAVMQAHYRSEMDFNNDILASATERLHTLSAYADQMLFAYKDQLPDKDESKATEKFIREFNLAITDDINTPAALSAFVHIEGKVFTQETLKALEYVESVLGVGLLSAKPLSSEEKALISDYDKAREQKQYVSSDNIRETLKTKHQLQISDTPHGPLVSRIR